MQPTYCNPLPLPDYPRGRACRGAMKSEPAWLQGEPHHFRETADPTVLYHGGKWYLYPSCGMAYVSDDFVTWRHHPIEPYDCGYAPTVVEWRGKFLLTACLAPLYRADNPLGPFHEVAPFLLPNGQPVPRWDDPMLFVDDDGELYAYWGLGAGGIKGARLDPQHPNKLVTEPAVLFSYNPDHVWERYGEQNEDISKSYCEGPWMLKHGGRYFLTYAAPGTQFSTYAMGCYVSDAPLGPFVYQHRNPICADREGLIRGPGHGCIVRGPGDTLWAFYTSTRCVYHWFERRVGMDPAGFDSDGNLYVNAASETPQLAPGLQPDPARGNDAGPRTVNYAKTATASSSAPGRTPDYATDGSMRTWWQPAAGDREPWLVASLDGRFTVSACRLIWAEPGLDYPAGRMPGPVRYVVEASDDPNGDRWIVALDRSRNDADLLIDYQAFAPVTARRLRVRLLDRPAGLDLGINDFAAFGVATAPA